ncbi:cytochrome C oxidase subunit III [Flavobacterium magnum]|uniref:Cytochrome C oxidase subunit III n=1 Tax=Flavobacterium magnum TaxID=2162713 RepID=A0A2S0RGX9_9FLAO|nr:cbb3-type cytochrome c oxidase N-terminal domain-containing protein [Flavobacterium magnum]AWA30924.1 cytochrome C oxidase subunit III [Flavobacterium magnum]
MKKFFPIYVRGPLIFFGFFGLIEFFVDSGNRPAFVKYPIIILILFVFLVIQIAVEYMVSAVNNLIYHITPEDKRNAFVAEDVVPLTQRKWFKRLMKRLTRSEPVENNALLLLDHNYDGIRELDNKLPPWWLYLFYGGIIFGAFYLVRYEILGADDQEAEFSKEMAQATIDIAEYRRHAPDLMDEESVTQLTDGPSLDKGKAIFQTNCAACHRADGGGQIGPNLTDDHWIFGGDIRNLFHTITNGGRDGKGMVSWKGTLKPTQIQQAASYILSLQGTHPKDPKAPDGDLWVRPEAKASMDKPTVK